MTDVLTRLNTALEGRYTVERELGAGGMATVYLARDLRHDRPVALKVLRPELAAILGGERFLQEIRTTANLQHPHILPLHDSGEAGGSVFYVMPYVEGESLRDRLEREKHLPIEDAVRIAREVASALDYAHRHGVVHRDIKPENILLHDGSALVADFGIALAVSRSDGGTRMTETGMSLGTPHYMSPEQAMGQREITPRSDVYALGCVTYEMLSGDPPFTGSTAQAIVARVVTEQPRQLTVQRHTIPVHVEAAVFKALEKLPADRFATAADLAEALINPAATASRTAAMPAAVADRRWRRTAVGAAAVAVLALGAAAWGWLRPVAEEPVIRYSLGMPADQGMVQGILGVNLAISRDGRRVVYVGPGERGVQLWLRDRDRLDATRLPGTEGAASPVFSPDGRRIAFSAGSNFVLKVVAVDGGPPVTLAEPGPGSGGGVAWGEDDWIYYDAPEGYRRVRAAGGESELIAPLDTARAEIGLAFPDVLPGGKRVLLRSRRDLNPDNFTLIVVEVPSGRRHTLVPGVVARYMAPGYLVFVRGDGALAAARFRPDDDTLRGPVTPLLEGIMVKPFGSVDIAVSPTGTLMYVPGTGSSVAGELVWIDRDGTARPLDPPQAVYPSGARALSLSPDGTRLAIDAVGERATDIWVKQLPSGPFSRLTFEGNNWRPTWTADGREVVFLSDRSGAPAVWRQRADGSAPAVLLRQAPVALNIAEAFVSRDGRWLVHRVQTSETGRDVLAVRLGVGQDTTAVPLLTGRASETAANLSPDGAWLAYVSDESGSEQVYVRPFPRTSDGRWQISTTGGTAPRWSRSGREILFESAAGEMMSVPMVTRPAFLAGQPRRLFALGASTWPSNIVPYYDLSPDDQRLIRVRLGGTSQTPGGGQLVVVEHWDRELRERVDGSRR
jgi:Tol biopolymer transport system component